MYGKVKRLRVRDKRLTDRENSQAIPVEGELKMAGHQWSMEFVLSIVQKNDHVSGSLILSLHDPRLVAMHNGGMRLVGTERPDGEEGPAYMQEWSIRVSS